MTRILVIDDQAPTLELLRQLFVSNGYEVNVMSDGEKAKRQLETVEYDVVFTDLRLGYPYDGLEVLEMVKRMQPRAQVVIMTAFSSVESSVLAMRGGAYDYITKPFKAEEVLLLAERASEKARLTEKVRSLEERLEGQVPEPDGPTQIVGRSPAMVQMMRLVTQVARTDATALVVGESGTGKELVARAVHQLSPRRDGPFVAVNCGAIPETLQESEFFGHAKGAFTGAIRTKTGLFEQADGGTLFLDEVGETSLATQVKLLRFLQEGEVRRVGENAPMHVNVRLVAATNRDLVDMIEEGSFRADLYYRLNIVAVEVPPLRERDDDIELLASFFLQKYARKLSSEVKAFADGALSALRDHYWPGNVRELENAVERAVTLARGPILHREDLPSFARGPRRGDENFAGGFRAVGVDGSAPQPRPSRWARTRATPASEGSRVSDVAEMFGAAASPRADGNSVASASVAPWQAAAWRPVTGPGSDAGGPFNRELEQARFPSIEEMERRHIEAALHLFKGSRTQAGRALGISKATLWRKIKRFGLEDAGKESS